MTTLLRKMWRTHSKHKKLAEEVALAECAEEGWWREARHTKTEGDVRYAGAVPVERSASAPATAVAVRSALNTSKSSVKKLQKVSLDISSKGILVTDADTKENVINLSIYKISYCSADAANARVFAVVEGRTSSSGPAGDQHIAHVFVCTRRKHARALALALAHAFNDAFQMWQSNQPSTLHSEGKRLAPWVRFPEESDDEEDILQEPADPWQNNAPLVSFA